jgi:hypothetical protein
MEDMALAVWCGILVNLYQVYIEVMEEYRRHNRA